MRHSATDDAAPRRSSGRVGLLIVAASTSTVTAEDDEAVRPNINLFHRWVEDWSALADPHLRTQPLDSLMPPAWLEGQRTAIERVLPRLALPQRAGVTSS
jgi:hypothetical protein